MSLIRPSLYVRLVRLAPVLSSTATLALALVEYQYLLPWFEFPVPGSQGSQSLSVNAHLPTWFNRWFRLSLASTLVLGVASAVGAKNAAASLYGGGGFVTARSLYTCGACFTVAHFAFSSPFRKCLRGLVHGAASNAKHELLLRWLDLHGIRTFMTDLPAWLCFVGAFMYTV